MSNTAIHPTQPAELSVSHGRERGLQLRSLDDITRFADILVKSGLTPSSFKTPQQVVIAVITGLELGISAMQSLQGLSVTNGKIGIMGDLALALCEATPECEGVNTEWSGTPLSDDWTCRVIVKRRHRDPKTGSFSVREAKMAGLWERPGPWKQYPQRMIYYRALGFALRDAFPHVLKGIKTTEELQDYPNEEPKSGFDHAKPVTDAIPQQAKAVETEVVTEPVTEAASDAPTKRQYTIKPEHGGTHSVWTGILTNAIEKTSKKGKVYYELQVDEDGQRKKAATFEEHVYLAATDAINAPVKVTVEPGQFEGSWKVVNFRLDDDLPMEDGQSSELAESSASS